MASVLDAIALDIWEIRKAGVITQGFVATFEAMGLTLTIKRDGGLLIVESEGLERQEILLRNTNVDNACTYDMITMLCPACGRSSLRLYLFEGKVKCRKCHKLKYSPESTIAEKQRFLDAAKEHLRICANMSFIRKQDFHTLGLLQRATLLGRDTCEQE